MRWWGDTPRTQVILSQTAVGAVAAVRELKKAKS